MKFTAILLSLVAGAAATPVLRPRQYYQSETWNQLTDGTPCRPTTIIYARGTDQPGNIGATTSIGVYLMGMLSQLLKDPMAVQGVDYAANILGFLEGGDPAGAKTMTKLVTQAASQCPNTRIVMVGYSQGAQVLHKAEKNLSAAVASRVVAVLTFGDPDQHQALAHIPASIWKVICHSDDSICNGDLIPNGDHTNYQDDDDIYNGAVFLENILNH